MFILIVIIIIRIISNPISNVLQKKLAYQQHPLFVNFISYFILTIFSLLLIYNSDFRFLNDEYWLYAILGGLFGSVGNGFMIKALEKGELSVLGPINSYKSIMGMLFAFLIIGEIPNTWAFIGIAFIIVGSYFILDQKNEPFSWTLFKQDSIKFRLFALVFTAIQAVFDKKLIQLTNLNIAFASWCFFGFLFSVPFLLTAKINFSKEFSKMNIEKSVKYFLLSISVAIMVASTNYLFSKMQVGEALALFQISILVSVFFGYHFFQEKGMLRKIVGSVIMITGSILILLNY